MFQGDYKMRFAFVLLLVAMAAVNVPLILAGSLAPWDIALILSRRPALT
jgi:hypothetical protein